MHINKKGILKIRNKIVLTIVVVMAFIVPISLLWCMNYSSSLNTANTCLYSATVHEVNVFYSADKPYVEIDTNEYKSSLLISSNVYECIQEDVVLSLKEGQQIQFRIYDNRKDGFDTFSFVDIVELTTDEKVIFSLDDYNSIMKDMLLVPSIILLGIMGVFVVSIILVVNGVKSKSI